MAEFPALPLWTDAWVADTHHLSIFSRGLYMDLLILMWRTPGCCVPADREWLMHRLRISDSDFDNVLKPLLKDLCQRNADTYMQKRLTREFAYVKAHSKKMSEIAKARWQKEKEPCNRNAPTPTPTPLVKKEKAIAFSIDQFESFWASCPRKIGKGAARKAYAKAVRTAAPDALLAAMRRYGSSRKGEDATYTVHPATWLNQERWLDQAAGNGASMGITLTDDERAEEQANLKRMGVIR